MLDELHKNELASVLGNILWEDVVQARGQPG
jgi:hypothetical protein